MSRLVSHIFSQRSFYPLSPPADEMSVDLKLTDTYSKLPFVPHVLLVPSDLRHFIKVRNRVSLTLCEQYF